MSRGDYCFRSWFEAENRRDSPLPYGSQLSSADVVFVLNEATQGKRRIADQAKVN